MNLFSTRHRRLIEVSVILAFLGAAPGLSVPAAKIEQSAEPPTISYDASYMDTDFKTQVMHLKDVTITYGKMTVRADRALATARDFKNSRWTFAGNVRINADPRGTDSDAIARGHANQIVYEVAAGTVRLSNDAWITDGKNDDIRGPVIVYSLREEHVEATTSPGTESRVHVTIAPNEAPKVDGAGTNKPKPTTGTPTAPTGAPAAAVSQQPPALQSPSSQSPTSLPPMSQSTPPTPR
jgi:lipopolysaccharide transport protein LptA